MRYDIIQHATGRDLQRLMADLPRGRFSHRIGTVAELQ
jgi:hypothetical protein